MRGIRGLRGQGIFRSTALLSLALAAACGEQEQILPGERLPLRAVEAAVTAPAAARPIALPAARFNAEWPQLAGGPAHDAGHVAASLSGAALWKATAGAPEDRGHRITAQPVVSGGRVFAMGATARVSAFDTAGRPLWARDLTPGPDRPGDASGGGLAVAGTTLFAATAFGELHALDVATGRTLWSQDLDAAATGAPTFSQGRVHLVTRNGIGWALDAAGGRIDWQVLGTPTPAGIVGGPAPAVGGGVVVYPFASGQLVAVSERDGSPAWSAQVGGRRIGLAFTTISDLTGDPVISGGTVYAGNHSGRTAAFDLATGSQRWAVDGGAMDPPVVAGGSVFFVDETARLHRRDAATGAEIWTRALPLFPQARRGRRLGSFAHHGPLLAGGRLWVASNDGLLRGYDPRDGRLMATLPLGREAASAPVAAGGTVYVVTDDGAVNALR